MAGLVRLTTNTELQQQEAHAARLDWESRNPEQFRTESLLAGHIRQCWQRNRRAKEPVETRLLQCLRQRNGDYDPQDLQAIREQGGSEIYMMLTAAKIRAGVAWAKDILMPSVDKAWGLEPTPLPEIPPEMMAMIQQRVRQDAMAQMQESGQQPTRGQMQAETERWTARIRKLAEERAKKACEAMEDKIHDQMLEGDWEPALEEFLEDFFTFPTAWMKGPLPMRKRTIEWQPGFQAKSAWEVRHQFKRVSPFDMYPSPEARNGQEGPLIERMKLFRGELYSLIGVPGYSETAIRAALEEYGRGGLKDWLYEDAERYRAEGVEKNWFRDGEERIEALQYWGSAQGLMLLEWGVDASMVPDPLAEYEIDAILIGNYVIRAEINDDPLGRRPYHAASYQMKPGAVWGKAMPELMRDHQQQCNASARALSNNMGISSGPQVIAYLNRLADGEKVTELYPWKIHQARMPDITDGGSSRPAIEFFQPDSHTQELMAVYEFYSREADETTGIPRYIQGDERVGGAGETASGLSMLMDAAGKGLKSCIGHIDRNVISASVHMLWLYNMTNDPDTSIKGDAKVVTKGTSVLVAKDNRLARLMQMLQATNNPVDAQIFTPEKRADMYREAFRAADLEPDLVPDSKEIAKRLEAQAQQPSPEEMEEQREQLKLQMEAREKDRRYALDSADTFADNAREDRKLSWQMGLDTARFKAEQAEPKKDQNAA